MSLHTEDSHWGLRTSHWDGDERISLIRNNWAKRTFLCVMLNLISTQKGKIWIVCSQAKCAACSSVSYTLKTWMNIKNWIIKSPSLSWSSCSKLCQDFLAFLFILTHQLRSVPRGDRKPIKHLNGKQMMTSILEAVLKLVNAAMLSWVSSTLKSGWEHGRHCQVIISEPSGADKAEKGRSAGPN